ncbi:chemotaxis protein CheA [Miltoncostaea oceani]|uniref:chemotaxis protein CheA n=1 Tax=Miltoncostaea oceani TaxID=2843216 RepID=UPI001C3DEF15|nr:chemotaxis protein CheA [Miltoncostaea oceani]
MDTSEYLGLFLDESGESLQTLNASLLDLERAPADPEPLTVIFRVAHSLKGMSATMGFESMAGLTHRMEEVLAAMRDDGAPVTPAVSDALFACLDTLQEMVDRVAAGDTEQVDASAVLARLDAISSGAAAAVAQTAATVAPPAPAAAPAGEVLSDYERMVVAEAHERGLSVLRVDVGFDEGCQLVAARAFMVVQELEGLGDLIRSDPTTEAIESGEAGEDGVVFWIVTDAAPDVAAAAALGVSEVARCDVSVVEPAAPAEEAPVEDAPAAPTPDAPVAGAPAPPAAERSPSRAAATVRVGVDRLDALMNLMGEMVIQRTRLEQLAHRHALGDLRGAVEEMSRVTNDLQTLIMQVRMMPVEAVFLRFPRMVRDLANTLGKRLELVITGEDTELDRTIIDGLGDPLVHMLRNAVDHGLESPEEREAAGKDPVGHVHLSARHAGNHVVIEVRDDGKGMDPEALRASVVRKGLMDAEAAAALSDEQALELVFLPGFSTAAQTTDVSGRGVGMDAVRNAIADLNGEVAIASTVGSGSVFTIRIPLTLAIIQALLVSSGAAGGPEHVFAVPLEAIEETVMVDRDEARPVNGRPCLVLRDAIVPLVWLGECLGMAPPDDADRLDVVVVTIGATRLGLVVEGLVGKQDVVIKHLPDYLGDVPGVAGATILGDGSVALIVDVAAVAAFAGLLP